MSSHLCPSAECAAGHMRYWNDCTGYLPPDYGAVAKAPALYACDGCGGQFAHVWVWQAATSLVLCDACMVARVQLAVAR